MAYVIDAAMDAKLQFIMDESEKLHFTSSEITSYASLAAASLGNVTPTFAAIANGDTSGRKLTCEEGTITGSANGTATHYAFVDVTGTRIIAANSVNPSFSVTSAVDVNFNAFDVLEDRDPTSE